MMRTPATIGQTAKSPTGQPSRPVGRRPKKISEYGQQLQEKQRLRNTYGLREKTFRRLYLLAAKNRSQTGQALLTNLERRLDNVIFRSGLASTRPQARQLIGHRHFCLNGRRVSIPSQLVVPGDKLTMNREGKIEVNPNSQSADWLKVEKKTGQITVSRYPEVSELPIEFDTQKVIEFYSR